MSRRSVGGKSNKIAERGAPPPSWQDELRAKAQASLSAVLQNPAATQSPRRWKTQLQDAIAEMQARAEDARYHAALARSAEERARIAEARTTEMEQRADAAEHRAQALEQRVMTAEATIARQIADMPSLPAPDHAEALRQLKDAHEAMLNAEERARKAERRAWDMEQRSLAAEAIIAGSR